MKGGGYSDVEIDWALQVLALCSGKHRRAHRELKRAPAGGDVQLPLEREKPAEAGLSFIAGVGFEPTTSGL